MINKIISTVLSLVLSLSLFTVAFAVDDTRTYDRVQLYVISDKLKDNEPVQNVDLYVDRKTNQPFISLDMAVKLIGGKYNCYEKQYDVTKDYLYFKYFDNENMKLYLSDSQSGIVLLDGKLFESRNINNNWYVDYLGFNSMFDVQLYKLDKEVINRQYDELSADGLNISIDDLNLYKQYTDFENTPYYIFMYSGTSLSSIYKQIMKYRKYYIWDYSSWGTPDNNAFVNVLSTLGIKATVHTGNICSNIVNDWNGFSSSVLTAYDPSAHYTDTLLDIMNVNYPAIALKYGLDDDTDLSIADTLQNLITTHSILDTLKDDTSNKFFDKLLEHGDYKKALKSMDFSNDFEITISWADLLVNGIQTLFESLELCEYLNNTDENTIQLLKKAFIDNESLSLSSEKQEKVNRFIELLGKNTLYTHDSKIRAINDVADVINHFGGKAYTINFPFTKIYLNTSDNALGLKESSQKLYDSYKDKWSQAKDTIDSVMDTINFSISDTVIQDILSSSPETYPIALLMGIFDTSMGFAQMTWGEKLSVLEKLAQCHYIQGVLMDDLGENDKETLRSRLVLLLQSSLWAFINSNEDSDSQVFEGQINDIADLLMQLDYHKDHITYFNDPRDYDVSNEIRELIFNGNNEENNNGTISGKVLTEDNKPIENAKIEVYTSSEDKYIRFGEDECYTNDKGEFSISMPEGKYLLVVTHDGYDPVNIKDVTVNKNKINHVANIIMKLIVNEDSSQIKWREVVGRNRLVTIAITTNDDLYAWGHNDDIKPKKILENVKKADIIDDTYWALTNNDELYMWGENDHGQVGSGSKKYQYTPLKVLDNVKIVQSSWKTIFAVNNNNELYMWGHNEYGEVGNGNTDDQLTPYMVLENVESVKCNGMSTAAITTNGDLYMWGYNSSGQVGNGKTNYQLTPYNTLSHVKYIQLGSTISAITTNDELYTWGTNTWGEIGNGNTNDQLTPYMVLENVKEIYSTEQTSMVLTNNGDIYVWGYNSPGVAGNGNTNFNQWKPFLALSNVENIQFDGYNVIALTSNGDLYTWGNNSWGQIGNGNTLSQLTPYRVLENVKAFHYYPEIASIFAINKDNVLYMWGNNFWGQIGNGNTKNQLEPYKVLEDVKEIQFDYYYGSRISTIAITTNNDLYMWGCNIYGKTGNGNTDDYQLTPYKSLENIKTIQHNYNITAAIDNDDNLYMWGYNAFGTIGNGSTDNQLTPYRVLDNIKKLEYLDSLDVMAIDNNDDLYVWGMVLKPSKVVVE